MAQITDKIAFDRVKFANALPSKINEMYTCDKKSGDLL